jgi:thiol-disulfide isomerase/thioredoxin
MINFHNLLSAMAIAALIVSPALAQQNPPKPLPPMNGPVSAAAQPAAPIAAPQIEAQTIDGKPFTLAALKGKVVLVMFWSTGCAVCRDKMPELRNNYEGWVGKPFEVVAISTDAQMQNLMEYERIISRIVPMKQRFVQIWAGAPGYKDNLGKHASLPAAYLLGKDGKVVERYVGRIPAEAWDKISDLL